MTPPPFETVDLVKEYGPVRALAGLTLAMKPGEVFGLLGPNGAGKTSLVSILTTLEKPTSGEVRLFGERLGAPRQKTFIGVVPQELVSHGFFNVEEVLQQHSGFYGIRENRKRIDFLLERLGLAAHRHKRVGQLSGGMKRRLLIAKALVHRPRLLLLDEPTAGVDIELRTSLWKFVRELNAEGMSILLTTHYLEEAEQLCDRVGIIHRGQLLRIGDTGELVRDLTNKEIEVVLQRPIPALRHPHLVSQRETRLTFRVPSQLKLNQLLAQADVPLDAVEDIYVREGTLEDAFLKLVVET